MSDKTNPWGGEGPHPPDDPPTEPAAPAPDQRRDNSRDNSRQVHDITLDGCNVYVGRAASPEALKAIEALAAASAEHAKALKAMARALAGGEGDAQNIGIVLGGDGITK